MTDQCVIDETQHSAFWKRMACAMASLCPRRQVITSVTFVKVAGSICDVELTTLN